MGIELEYKISVLDRLIDRYIQHHDIKTHENVPVKVDGETFVSRFVFEKDFSTGYTVMTNTISQWANDDKEPRLREFRHKFLNLCLLRHVNGDWGINNYIEDFLENEDSLVEGNRIMSTYYYEDDNHDKQTIWIITEYDRSVTTVLDPMDY